MPQLPNVRQLRETIQRRQANWHPQEYPWIRELPEERLVNRLGAQLDEQRLTELHEQGEPDIAEVIRRFRSHTHPDGISPMSRQLATTTALTRPTSVDWRNRNGRSWITPVKDQGNCGSCVGFCCTALIESMVCIEHGLETDLSEADLFFCGGANCDGWNTDAGIDGILNRGVSLEHCFPYRAQNMACSPCGSRNEEAIRASERRVFWHVESRKRYLADVGPMAAVFDVFSDFFLYSTGVYTHVSGDFTGRHCVLVVGYDDNQQCWICKNSWGVGWGDNGFFRIGYGECGIDDYSTFLGLQFGSPFWGVFGTRLPSRYRFRFFTGRFEGTGRTDVLTHCAASSDWWLGRKPGSQLQWSRSGNTRGFGNVDDGRPFWTGNFSGASQSEVLFYYPGDHNWWLGRLASGQLQWSLAGNTAGFGRLADGRPFWIGDFNGNGRSDVLFYYPGDRNWWLGSHDGSKLQWSLAGNTAGFGQVWDGRPFWIGRFSRSDRHEVLFYYPGDHNWWLGSHDGSKLQWSLAGNTTGFGQVWDGRPFWIGDFNGNGRSDVLFYYPGDHNWWLGSHDGSKLQWSLIGNTAGFGNVWDGRPIWTGGFGGTGRDDVMFYYPGDRNWWLGQVSGGQLQWSLVGNTTRAFALA